MAFVSASGAKSSSEKPRYDLIYRGFLKRLAERLGYGAEVHGERNYEQGVGDAVYRRDRINHLIEHALKYAEGDTSTDHLSAIAANANILAYLDDHAPEAGTSVPNSGAFTINEQPQIMYAFPPNIDRSPNQCSCDQGDGAVGGEPV